MTLYIVYNPSGIVQRYCSRLQGYIIENNFSSIEAEDKLDRVVKSMAGGGEIKKRTKKKEKDGAMCIYTTAEERRR